MVKNLPAMRETWVQSLSGEDPLEKGMKIHSSIFAWRTPWTEEPGGLQGRGPQESDITEQHTHTHTHTLIILGFPDGPVVKESAYQCSWHGFNPWEDLLEEAMVTHSSILS